MALRFYRRVRLFPGVTMNLSRSGPSVSVGIRGAHVTVGPRGVTRTVGIPGTGIFWTSRTGVQTGAHTATAPSDVGPVSANSMIAGIMIVGLVLIALAEAGGNMTGWLVLLGLAVGAVLLTRYNADRNARTLKAYEEAVENFSSAHTRLAGFIEGHFSVRKSARCDDAHFAVFRLPENGRQSIECTCKTCGEASWFRSSSAYPASEFDNLLGSWEAARDALITAGRAEHRAMDTEEARAAMRIQIVAWDALP